MALRVSFSSNFTSLRNDFETKKRGDIGFSNKKLTKYSFFSSELIHDSISEFKQRLGSSFRVNKYKKESLIKIFSLDAAMPFDFEAIQKRQLSKQNQLKIGIVGFGNFGQFLAKRFVKHGHDVLALSRSDYSAIADSMKVRFFRDADDFCEEHPNIVLLCTSILSTDAVLRTLPLQRLKRNTLFVDVLSVKAFPRNLFLQVLPPDFDILCTHPMFGPESGKHTWKDLPFVFDRVRVGDDGPRNERCNKFLQIFEKEGCRMVEMNCDEHDKYAASSQFITHTVGRVLGKLGLESSPINTKGYETLLQLVENTAGDSFDLYYGLFMYNTNATEELQRLERAFDDVKKQLFDQLHDILRAQLFDTSPSTAMYLKNGDTNLQFPSGQALPSASGSQTRKTVAMIPQSKTSVEDEEDEDVDVDGDKTEEDREEELQNPRLWGV